MTHSELWKRIRRVQVDRATNEQAIATAEAEAATQLRGILERRKIVESRLEEARRHLAEVEEPEAFRLAKLVEFWWLTPLLAAAFVVAVWANLWGLETFTSLEFEKRLGLAAGIAVFSLLGGCAVGKALRMMPGEGNRKVFFGVGFAVLVLAILATVTITVVRGLDTEALEQAERRAATRSDDLDAPAQEMRPEAGRARTAALVAVGSATAGVAGELASAWTFDQLLTLLVAVWTVAMLRRRVRTLEDEVVDLAVAEETARQRPALVRAQHSSQILAMEEVETATIQRAIEEKKGPPQEPLGPLAWKILTAIVLLAALIAGSVAYARAAESERSGRTIILLDLSRSSLAGDEFNRNLAAVEGLILRVKEPRHRLVVFGVTQASFGEAPLLASTAPRNPGRYGEYLEEWHRGLVRQWRSLKPQLTPAHVGSDLFGALARAGTELGEQQGGSRRIIVFSDMRHVGRGFNFERALHGPRILLARTESNGLVPRLVGVEVLVLGAHTVGIEETHWLNLKAFWTGYFKRAGADLRVFTPNRRLTNG